jgi:hypothetical protein
MWGTDCKHVYIMLTNEKIRKSIWVNIFKLETRALSVLQNILFRYSLPMRNRGYVYCVRNVEQKVFSPLKGIISRDLHICFWYHSIDRKFLHLKEPFVRSFPCRIIWFSRLGVVLVSLPCEWSWTGIYSHSGAQRQDIFLLVLHWKLIRAPAISKNYTSGAAGLPV